MTRVMTLSFIVPTRDTPELLLACIASVAREAPRAEVVVVDDGGRDDIARRVRALLPSAATLRLDNGRGFAAAANAGFEIARGGLLVCLNSDTELQPGAVEALVDAFSKNPRLGIVGGNLRYPDGKPQWSGGAEPDLLWLFALVSGLGRLRGERRRSAAPPRDASAVRFCDWVSGAAIAIRRPVWEACGPFSEGFRFYAQDLEFCRLAFDQGWRIAVAEGFRVLHHHGATVSSRGGAAGGQRLDLLWADLADWYERRHGGNAGRLARRTMRTAARLRALLPGDPTTRRAVTAGLSALRGEASREAAGRSGDPRGPLD